MSICYNGRVPRDQNFQNLSISQSLKTSLLRANRITSVDTDTVALCADTTNLPPTTSSTMVFSGGVAYGGEPGEGFMVYAHPMGCTNGSLYLPPSVGRTHFTSGAVTLRKFRAWMNNATALTPYVLSVLTGDSMGTLTPIADYTFTCLDSQLTPVSFSSDTEITLPANTLITVLLQNANSTASVGVSWSFEYVQA